ncbi:MAG: hypothetical protein JO019_02670 [Candidatus Kaiserbacteria bacterium]|nr:hypothetical protein [Candidatus Kaiserbacteria bacterium]
MRKFLLAFAFLIGWANLAQAMQCIYTPTSGGFIRTCTWWGPVQRQGYAPQQYAPQMRQYAPQGPQMPQGRFVGIFEFEANPSPYGPGWGPPRDPPGGVGPGAPRMCGVFKCSNQPPEYYRDPYQRR